MNTVVFHDITRRLMTHIIVILSLLYMCRSELEEHIAGIQRVPSHDAVF